MAGLDPAIHDLDWLIVEIIPVRVSLMDQTHLRSTRPMLEIFLSLYCQFDGCVRLGIDQSFQAVHLGETVGDTFPMFPDAAGKIVRHPDVKRAVRATGQDINPSVRHGSMVVNGIAQRHEVVDGRVKPGHDEVGADVRSWLLADLQNQDLGYPLSTGERTCSLMSAVR
jgi:hypothetical protein